VNSWINSPAGEPRYFDAWPSEGVVHYPGYDFLLELHVYLMRDVWHEVYYGPTRPELLQSALARPRKARGTVRGWRSARFAFVPVAA